MSFIQCMAPGPINHNLKPQLNTMLLSSSCVFFMVLFCNLSVLHKHREFIFTAAVAIRCIITIILQMEN